MQWKYLPILKWKQGERIALRKLSNAQWGTIVPIIELQAIAAAPSAASIRAAMPDYLAKIAKQIAETFPEDTPVLVDTRYVSPGFSDQARLLLWVCLALQRALEHKVVPVVSEGMLDREAGVVAEMKSFPAQVLRIRTTYGGPAQLTAVVAAAVAAGLKRKSLHLVVDQYALVGADPAVAAAHVQPHVSAAIATACASVTLAGGSFPLNLIGIKAGVSDVSRVEWNIWTRLRATGKFPELRYGDYAVTNPAPLPEIDPKQVNPAVAIRYATTSKWRLFKGGGFKNGKPNQYNNLCKLLISESVYSGAAFSYGDDCYDKAASLKLAGGNPSSWRRDATSHHLVFVKSQL